MGPRRIARDQRGSALLIGLFLVMLMTLVGIALFEMSTIEAKLVSSDLLDAQAFYCADAQATRVYNLYAPEHDPSGSLPSQSFGPTAVNLANGTFVFSGAAVVNPATRLVTVFATCAMPNGRTRTVVRNGTRIPPSDLLQFAAVLGGFNPGTGSQDLSMTLNFTGESIPALIGGPYVGGADSVIGDVYASANVYVGGQASVNGQISSGADSRSLLGAMPVLSNSQGTGVIDEIQAALINPDRSAKMKGTYQGATVYNLSEIFRQLGATNEGNAERNLARPRNCAYSVASSDPNCQIWQDLVLIGPKQVCNPTCPGGIQGPTDKPSYFFMGVPRTTAIAPQGTRFDVLFAAAVGASPELRQMGFTAQYTSLGARLDALLGSNPDDPGSATPQYPALRVDRLVDFTVGTDAATAQPVLRSQAPIFYVDGYWRADAGTAGFAYNGRATVVASKSAIVGDNLVYLNSVGNTNTELPAASACPNGTGDRTACGLADLFGVLAKQDIWIEDTTGPVHEIAGVMLAGRDVNLLEYTSGATCCNGPSNPVTFSGSIVATRQLALARDWADPIVGQENVSCTTAQSPCMPVMFFAGETTCGAVGCWKFMTIDPATGLLVVDTSKPTFKDGCTIASPSCTAGARRVTHFQIKVKYDDRLRTHAYLIPPGLPAGRNQGYQRLNPQGNVIPWKDCGSNPACP